MASRRQQVRQRRHVGDLISVLPGLKHQVRHDQSRISVRHIDVEVLSDPWHDLTPAVEHGAVASRVDRRRATLRTCSA
jgi:hypothetical protein